MNDFARANPLLDYQRFAVKWTLERLYERDWPGAGLFLDPGLGKTRTTLTVLDTLFRLGEIRRALVVAPLRPMYSVWPGEIRKWGFNHSHIVLHDQHVTAMREGCRIELINPEGLDKLARVRNRWDIIVVDESTKFKTWGTNRLKYLRGVLAGIPKRIILTGTPAANSLADLHAQIFILDEGERLGDTVTKFRERYMSRGGFKGWAWKMRPGVKDTLLSKIDDIVLRMKAEDFLDMPKLVINHIWCDMGAKAEREYRRLKRELKASLETGDVLVGSAVAAYTKCKQFANGTCYKTDEDGSRTSHAAHDAKIDALEDLHEELCGKPLLIAYSYSHDADRIKERRRFKNAPVLKGQMKEKDVDAIVKKWNAGQLPALLCQPQSVSHGMNMQESCNDVAWFGLTDSPETYDQFFRRVYRLGVKGDQVRVHRLLTRETVDEQMLERLEDKNMTQAEFLERLKKHAA